MTSMVWGLMTVSPALSVASTVMVVGPNVSSPTKFTSRSRSMLACAAHVTSMVPATERVSTSATRTV